ncbi:serpin family protein [Alienimonas sp. DA493]|uniref:serpin family protein n=1 Tax=Alienimonas sp. DA493 TaxID=3373605 RepID=UPI0037552DCC
MSAPALLTLSLFTAAVPPPNDLGTRPVGVWTVWAAVSAGGGNVAFSPTGVRRTVAMLRPAVAGTAAGDLDHAFPDLEAVGPVPPDGPFSALDAIWVRTGLPIRPTYRAAVERIGGEVKSLPTADPTAAVNRWIEVGTAERVRGLFPPGALDGAELVLVDALSFRGTWPTPFRPTQTPIRFRTASGSVVTAPGMTITTTCRYAPPEADRPAAVELPYAAGLALTVLLPPAGEEGPASLTESELAAVRAALRPARVTVTLPPFSIRSRHNLLDPLAAAGAGAAVAAGADFSPLTPRPAGLTVGTLVQEAVVTVDEQGTSAAAATGGAVVRFGRRDPPAAFTADRPFLFVIAPVAAAPGGPAAERPRPAAPLFLGRVADPTEPDDRD